MRLEDALKELLFSKWGETKETESILRSVNSHEALLDAVKAQHDAIDILFAMLIKQDIKFYPTKSGKPWEAVLKGNNAIAQAEEK